LLEKSRLVYQQGIERNFHIFYQILKSFGQGTAGGKMLAKYELMPLENYHYVNQSEVSSIDDVDDV